MKKFIIIAIILIACPCLLSRIINIPADYPTITEGIEASVDGDTVLVAPGDNWAGFSLQGKNILVTSSHGPDTTRINGSIIFENAEDATCIVRGFYINEPTWAPSIACRNNSSPIIEGNKIADHEGYGGAGISIGASECIVKNNIIYSNRNLYGGGAIRISGKNSLITQNIFYDNTSYGYGGTGGAIEIIGHSSITFNVFYNNQALGNLAGGAVGKGGAIYRRINPDHNTGVTRIINNTFWSNKALEDESHGIGGALYNYSSNLYDTLIVENNIFANNIASTGIGSGAYIYINDSMSFI